METPSSGQVVYRVIRTEEDIVGSCHYVEAHAGERGMVLRSHDGGLHVVGLESPFVHKDSTVVVDKWDGQQWAASRQRALVLTAAYVDAAVANLELLAQELRTRAVDSKEPSP